MGFKKTRLVVLVTDCDEEFYLQIHLIIRIRIPLLVPQMGTFLHHSSQRTVVL